VEEGEMMGVGGTPLMPFLREMRDETKGSGVLCVRP
jgi:hypothetical protein